MLPDQIKEIGRHAHLYGMGAIHPVIPLNQARALLLDASMRTVFDASMPPNEMEMVVDHVLASIASRYGDVFATMFQLEKKEVGASKIGG